MEIVHFTTNTGIKLTVNESRCNGDTTNVRSKLWRKTTQNGSDEIPNWILRDYATTLAPPVCAIFNSSVREGIVPQLVPLEMRRHMTSIQSATAEAHSQRPAANITHAGIVKVLGAFHLRLDNGHRRRPR